ncbi:MAG: endolytic transglycosylase MltG [Halioglobus sp.]|nr:endolytic transglycosylase MltG [Halioglobus sp.]
MRVVRVALVLVLLAGAGAAWLALEINRLWHEPLNIPAAGYRLQVAPGASLRTVARTLGQDGVIAHPELLVLFGRIEGADARIKLGEYALNPGLTGPGLLSMLEEGDVVQYQVTLPEGITLAQALARLARAEGLVSVLESAEDPRLYELVAGYPHPEGLFFPDSYQFTRGDSDLDILARAHRRMRDVLAQEWAGRAGELPLETPYEALILASIVERETGVAAERETIAGVFVRRLQRRMRLQTDPTVIYGLGAQYNGNLKRAHLADDANPYNTYRHHGLPPTPIALPGRAAIHAALHPAAGNSLYFVARGDGSHAFSATLAEHNRAVRKYQLKRRKDYRSSPETH